MTTEAIQVQDYIERIAQIHEANLKIFPIPTVGKSLVTKVIRNKPAIIQSASNGIIPYIVVFEPLSPINMIEKVGRDTRDVEGGTLYEVEIYSVCIIGGLLDTQTAQRRARQVTQAMRDGLGRNLRLGKPADKSDPLCRTHTRYEIAYNLPGTAPKDMIAINIVVRAQVYVSLRSDT